LIVSPAASEKALGYRLFRRAIIESGGVFGLPIIEQRTRGDLATAIRIGEELQDNILGSTVDDQEALTQLRNGDSNMTKALVDKTRVVFENFLSPTTNLYSLMPSFDGYALPLNPVAAFQDPELSQDVDLLVGYNTDEASSWIQEADLPPELFTN
jgi:carboxylesterase type B